jgi:uncharacterized protein (DUF1501 family)
MMIKIKRRAFLQQSLALSSVGLAAGLPNIGLSQAMAQAAPNDYKALVCVFLFGGNDGNNILVPLDNTGWNQYTTVRTAASGIQHTRDTLLPIATTQGSFGLHPAMAAMQGLYNDKRLAFLANVGTLVAPTTKADYQAGRNRPNSLFSHSDQQLQWQSTISNDLARSGWGGRMADRVAALNAGATYPTVTSLAGTNLFSMGDQTRPLTSPTNASFQLAGFANNAAGNARLAALRDLMSDAEFNTFVNAANVTSAQAINLSGIVNPILSTTTSTVRDLFPAAITGTSIGNQLFTVAKMIEARATIGLKRQIFFVSIGGFDTHTGQVNAHANLWGQISPALKAFYDATARMGVANNVTTFSLTDFGRTFRPAAGGGTDHAWGNHTFMMGGAVKGGEMYGRYPTLVLQGPDDVASEGRWLPSTSVDQYGATLASWFGVPTADLAKVFPYINRFNTPNLGFIA